MIWVMLNETRKVNMHKWPALKQYSSLQIHWTRLSRYTLRTSGISTSYTFTSHFCSMCKGHIAYIYWPLGQTVEPISLKLTKDFKNRNKQCIKVTSRPYTIVIRVWWKEESRRLTAASVFLSRCAQIIYSDYKEDPSPPFMENQKHLDNYHLWIRDVGTTIHKCLKMVFSCVFCYNSLAIPWASKDLLGL